MYCSRTLTPSGGRAEQLRGGALGAMPTTKKVLTRAEAKAMALRDGVEQVVLTQDVDDMQRVANERKERAECWYILSLQSELHHALRVQATILEWVREWAIGTFLSFAPYATNVKITKLIASVAIALVVVHHHPPPPSTSSSSF
jgi:hypothetical protein